MKGKILFVGEFQMPESSIRTAFYLWILLVIIAIIPFAFQGFHITALFGITIMTLLSQGLVLMAILELERRTKNRKSEIKPA